MICNKPSVFDDPSKGLKGLVFGVQSAPRVVAGDGRDAPGRPEADGTDPRSE